MKTEQWDTKAIWQWQSQINSLLPPTTNCKGLLLCPGFARVAVPTVKELLWQGENQLILILWKSIASRTILGGSRRQVALNRHFNWIPPFLLKLNGGRTGCQQCPELLAGATYSFWRNSSAGSNCTANSSRLNHFRFMPVKSKRCL